MSVADTTRIYFPDAEATEKILKILWAFCPEEQKMILAAVEANASSFPAKAWRGRLPSRIVDISEGPPAVSAEAGSVAPWADRFIAECLQPAPGEYVRLSHVRDAYVAWVELAGEPSPPETYVISILKSKLPMARVDLNGHMTVCVEGFRLRNSKEVSA